MATPRTITKPANELQPGERIVTSIPGRAVFFDRIEAVEPTGDGRVTVQFKGYSGRIFYHDNDSVRVLP